MKKVIIKLLIPLLGIFLLSCGESGSSISKSVANELPILAQTSNVRALSSDAQAIINSVNQAAWGYYRDSTQQRWYISQVTTIKSTIYSLMAIKDNRAGWGTVGSNVAAMNLTNENVTIDYIANNSECQYYDAGWQAYNVDCLIQSDIEKIRNSTVNIDWWFFKNTTTNAWYIINKAGSVYKFASKDGQYDWQPIDMGGAVPNFYVENSKKYFSYNNDIKTMGIDVSVHNGTINWNSVANSGIKFAFIKATEGYPDYSWSEDQASDSKFESNMQNALNSGLLVGAYHFVRPEYNIGEAEAIKEATHFANEIAYYYQNNKLLPPVIDLETGGSSYSKQDLTNWVLAFGNAIKEQLGVEPILYLNENYANNEVYLSQIPYKVWVAKYLYNASEGISINTLDDINAIQSEFEPSISNWSFWQFSSTGTDVGGISSYVDKNIFQGSLLQLQSLLVQSSSINIKPSGTVGGFQDIIQGTSSLTIKMEASGKNLSKITLHVIKDGESVLDVDRSWSISGDSAYQEYLLNTSSYTVGKYNYAYFVKDATGRYVSYTGSFNVSSSQSVNFASTAYTTRNKSWVAGMAPRRFYNYSIGQYSELGVCSSTGVEALGNCTWYALGRSIELGKSETLANKFLGDASSWDETARNNGIPISSTPVVGAVAQHNVGTYGHVAIVEKINSDGTITISESGYAPCYPTWNFEYRQRDVYPNAFENYILIP